MNDDIQTLIKLYDKMRIKNEPHYLFHAIPMRGMSHHRTSVKKGLELSMKLNSSGYFSEDQTKIYLNDRSWKSSTL